jgi:hypothetical protein
MTDSWAPVAACLDHPHPEWWWPEKGHDATSSAANAKAICAQCPSLYPCLVQSLVAREEHGIRGGAGGQLRRWLLRAWTEGGDVWEAAFATHLARLDGERIVVDTNGPDATHGLAVTYARGCRCEPCSWAIARRDVRPLRAVGDRADAKSIAVQQSARVPTFLTQRRTA